MAPSTPGADSEFTPSDIGTPLPCPAHPAARELLPPDAPRDQWLEARRQGIGGSDASTLLGFNPYSSLLELWLDKTGRAGPDIDNAALEWGRRLEPVIRDYFTDATGIAVSRAGLLQSIEHPLALVTPDGLTSDGGLLEIKTTSWRKAKEWADDQVADHAELQVQHAMMVTGLPHAWVVVLIDGRRPLIRRVEADPVIAAEIVAAIDWFWNTYVIPGQAPPLSGAAPENAAIRQLYPAEVAGKAVVASPELLELLGQWRHAKQLGKDADEEIEAIETRIRALVGDAERVVLPGNEDDEDPKPIATLRANGTFSEKRLRAAEPDVAEQFTVERTERVFDLEAFKRTKPDLYARYRGRVLRVSAALDQFEAGA